MFLCFRIKVLIARVYLSDGSDLPVNQLYTVCLVTPTTSDTKDTGILRLMQSLPRRTPRVRPLAFLFLSIKEVLYPYGIIRTILR